MSATTLGTNGPANKAPATATPEIPQLADDATPEQRDEHWYRYVYQGDDMPQLTLRAVLMGGCIGMAMCCAHLYTVLAVGWSFGVAITACVMSYVIWNVLRVISGKRLSRMSILENNCMQSTASAAGYSTGTTMATCFGALLLITGSQVDWRIAAAFTLATGAMGVWLAIPMKRQMINHEQLAFPSGIAAAATLRSLYSEGAEALRKAYSLMGALFFGLLVGFLKCSDKTLEKIGFLRRFFGWIEQRLFHIRLPDQLPEHGWYQFQAKPIQALGFDPSVLLIGAGMIVGMRVSLTMLAGSLLLYFFVAPWLLEMDAAHAGEAGYLISIPQNTAGTFRVHLWSLWGGTALMVCASLTALALQWRTMARAFSVFRRGGQDSDKVATSMAHIEVPNSWFIGGLVPIMIAMLLIQYIAFGISLWLGLIAIGMAFVLSLVAARSTGETDTTPTGAMGKVMQLLFGVLSPGNVPHNLVSAGIAANSASSGSDLLIDLKSGYLLGANPRKQFVAQFIGIFFGTAAILPCWYLMIPNPKALENYPAPATQQWAAVARLLTEGVDKLPHTARLAILIGGLVGVALPILERLIPSRAKKYFPSAMGLGLSWVVYHSNALAFATGATIVWLWGLVHRRHRDNYSVAVASGLIAGESLIQGIIAMLATAMGLWAASK